MPIISSSQISANNLHYSLNNKDNGIGETGGIIIGSILGGILLLCGLTTCIYWLYNNYCNKAIINRKKEIMLQQELAMKNRLEEQIQYTAKIKNISIDEARKLDKHLLHPLELVPISFRNCKSNNIDTIDKLRNDNIEESRKREELGLNSIGIQHHYYPNINVDKPEIIKEETIV